MSKAETSKPTDNKDSKSKNEVVENLRSINKGEYLKQCIIPFRDLLNEIKKDTNADLEELAEGLGLSRQTVIQFLNDENEDDPYQPPIGRINIITLWQTLTDKSIYLKRERAKKKLQPKHETARSNFHKNGLNRMLTTMGFQAIGVIDGNNLSKASIEKAYRIVSSLSSDRVTDEVVWKIEDSISEQILNSIINKNESRSTVHVSEEAILHALKDYEESEAEGSKISDARILAKKSLMK
jgi:transcriptional regulator with XRE-family HTH domain